jgi:hypothetical protein
MNYLPHHRQMPPHVCWRWIIGYTALFWALMAWWLL